MPGLRQHPLPHHDRRQKQCVLWEMSTIKSCGGGLCKCENERHRNDFIKYITPWWFENNLLTRCVSCSVRSPISRPSPKLASSRLRQRLFWAAASQTSRRKPCYRQSDLFSNSSWLYYFTHHILQCSSSAHCQKLLAWRGALKRNSLSSQKAEHEKTVSTLFTILMRNVLILKTFCVRQRGKRLFHASV